MIVDCINFCERFIQKLENISTFEKFKDKYMKSGQCLEAQTPHMKSNRKDIHSKLNDDNGTLTRDLARKLFRSQQHFRFRKTDSIDGPLYINPHIIDAIEKPKKCKNLIED